MPVTNTTPPSLFFSHNKRKKKPHCEASRTGTPKHLSTKTLPPGIPAIRSLLRVKLTKRMKVAPGSIVAVGGADLTLMTPNRIWEGHNGGKDCCGRKRPTCLVSFACATSSMTTFCYSRDFANALYVVSKEENRPLSMGRFWICPHTPHPPTTDRTVISRI